MYINTKFLIYFDKLIKFNYMDIDSDSISFSNNSL